MLMTYENLKRLLNIWDKPDLSALTRLLVARRMARQYQFGWEADRTCADRKIKEARKGLPFTRAQLEQAKEFRKTSSSYHEKAHAALGAWLLQAERWIEGEIESIASAMPSASIRSTAPPSKAPSLGRCSITSPSSKALRTARMLSAEGERRT